MDTMTNDTINIRITKQAHEDLKELARLTKRKQIVAIEILLRREVARLQKREKEKGQGSADESQNDD